MPCLIVPYNLHKVPDVDWFCPVCQDLGTGDDAGGDVDDDDDDEEDA